MIAAIGTLRIARIRPHRRRNEEENFHRAYRSADFSRQSRKPTEVGTT
ncbi:hypothetical protein [Candidatus Chloroploca sp. Khr17]|nr:hypothetical protein [Candidatus Chloroploca sp. Khr17]